MNRFIFPVLGKLYQFPKIVLLGLTLIVLILSTQYHRLHLDASADSLVLEGDRALDVYRDINKRYGSEDFLVITFSPKEPLFSNAALATLQSLKEELQALQQVSSVVTILDVPLLYSPPVKLSELSEGIRYLSNDATDRALARAEFTNSPLYSQLLTSENFDTTAIQVNLKRDDTFFKLLYERDQLRDKQTVEGLTPSEQQALESAEQAYSDYLVESNNRQDVLVENVRNILDGYRDRGTLYLGGVPMIASDMIDFIKNDIVVFGIGIIVFIVLLLAVIFRRIVWVLLPLFTCLMAVAVMLGVISMLDWKLTVISSNFVALLMIITLSITIHLAVRFRELSTDYTQSSPFELVMNTVRYMLRPCLYTAVTTIVAFASLVVSGIRPVIDFGWMMTIGVTGAFVVTFLVIPAGLMLVPLKRSKAIKVSSQSPAFTLFFAKVADKYSAWVWLLSFILLAVSIIGVSQLKVENRFIDYFDENTEIYQGMEVIDQKLGGTIPLDIIIRVNSQSKEVAQLDRPLSDVNNDNNKVETDTFEDISFDVFDAGLEDPFGDKPSTTFGYWFTRHGLTKIEQLHHHVDQLEETGKVISLASLYQVMKDVTGADIDDFQLALIGQNLTDDIKRALVNPYISKDGNEARITVRVKETSYQLNRNILLEQLEEYLQDEMGLSRSEYELTGMLVLYNNMLQSLFSSQIVTLGAVFFAITLMFTLLFRSLFMALIAITPNLLAAGMVLGGMGVLGIPLDMMTITVAAITVGIGVDDTIHYIHRFKDEFAKDQNYVATMYRCHGSIGRAMFYTSVIIIIGFSILTLSNFTPTIYFGLLTGFAMFSALLGSLVLLPRLILTLKPLGKGVQ
ncbi:efflux RND transporter permease subunit [Alkalimarinus alittae]|uniref:MMPL family transporter n=1 Tax=Alkalimarinus alittae TaxID=2961619 RepID=A0ABY6MXP7_9ALTE|nr:MMPL family transporter [Alkalimarinus alittae]UZE94601.1 MMPL family transporter [Alkalimarinus alittae]